MLMYAESQNHAIRQYTRNNYLPLHQWLHSSEIPGWTGYPEVCCKRKTTITMSIQRFQIVLL